MNSAEGESGGVLLQVVKVNVCEREAPELRQEGDFEDAEHVKRFLVLLGVACEGEESVVNDNDRERKLSREKGNGLEKEGREDGQSLRSKGESSALKRLSLPSLVSIQAQSHDKCP
jgi:hypothetical protein